MIGCETRIRKLVSGIVMFLKEEIYFSKYVNILCENLVDNNKIWIDFQKLREMTCYIFPVGLCLHQVIIKRCLPSAFPLIDVAKKQKNRQPVSRFNDVARKEGCISTN